MRTALLDFIEEEFGDEALDGARRMETILVAETLYLWGADHAGSMSSVGYRAHSAATQAGLRIGPNLRSENLGDEQRELYRTFGGDIPFTVQMRDPVTDDVVWFGEAEEVRKNPERWGLDDDNAAAILDELLVVAADHEFVVVDRLHWRRVAA